VRFRLNSSYGSLMSIVNLKLPFSVWLPKLLVAVILPTLSSANAEDQAAVIANDYCESFSNVAADFRARLQKEELERLKQEIDGKLREVKARTDELNSAMEKRDLMLALASEEVLKIYTRMEAEPAAKQLEKIDIETAASVIRRLKPQLASDILAAMDVKHASSLVQMIARQNALIEGDGKS
jgi:flagellar motility protein MotE (MotC chaperone)